MRERERTKDERWEVETHWSLYVHALPLLHSLSFFFFFFFHSLTQTCPFFRHRTRVVHKGLKDRTSQLVKQQTIEANIDY